MTTFRMPRDHRPIVYDSSYPIAGGRDDGEGGRATDARLRDPQPSELAKMFPTSINPKLAPNAGARDLSATDSRVLDHRPGELSRLFADAPNPSTRVR
jgi:hypothetical protein